MRPVAGTPLPVEAGARGRYCRSVPRISSTNQVTLPLTAMSAAGLCAGDEVVIEPTGAGELRVRRATLTFDEAFGIFSGAFPAGRLQQLDDEDDKRSRG